MSRSSRLFLGLGALALFLATALGAYGSHALASQLPAATYNAFSTAIDYGFDHGLGLCATAVLAALEPRSRYFRAAAYALLAGLVLFCGGIVATTFGAAPAIGHLVPLGGLAFMAGWLLLALGALFARQSRTTDPLA